VTKLNERTPHV